MVVSDENHIIHENIALKAVVKLLSNGVEGGRTYIVTELDNADL